MRKMTAALVGCFFSVGAQAAGFALIEQSGSGMGNAFAGAAASAEDASTIFFNPAGMTYIQGSQVVGALHLIKPSAHFNDEGSTGGLFRPKGGEGGDLGDLAFVPNFYYERPFAAFLIKKITHRKKYFSLFTIKRVIFR